MPLNIIILGAGVAGLTSALALRKHLPSPKPKITVYEIRPAPSTIGGAVNLTPKALRYLDHLGVFEIMLSKGIGAECRVIDLFDLYSGKKYSEVEFRGADGKGIGKTEDQKYFARRVERYQLQGALLEACQAQQDTQVVFGKKTTQIEESDEEGVRLTFEDGETITGDVLIGCDGIHSIARNLLVQNDRNPKYTGVSTIMARAELRPGTQLKWETTGLVSSRRGSLMCSYIDNTRVKQYVAAVIQVAEVESREGWRIKGSDQKAMKEDIMGRFKCKNMPELAEMIEDAGDLSLYPVYALPPQGKWSSPGGKCILIGDAAHAMAPQGESTGICIEDAIVLSRALLHHQAKSLRSIFSAYEAFRRSYIEAAVKQAAQRWENVKDSGWFVYQMLCFLTPWILWWSAKAREQEFAEDYSDLDLEVHD